MKKSHKKIFQGALKNLIKGEKIVRKNIKKESREKQLFWLCLRIFISHSKAIILLCEKKHNLEALMVLRPLIELTVNTRWSLQKEENLQKFMEHTEYEFKDDLPKMGEPWTINLWEKMKAIGFSKQYYDTVVKKLHEVLHCNPTLIARTHHKNMTAMDSEAIFSVAAQFSGHLLKVANTLYPNGPFIKHNDILQEIRYKK
ncbi:MAG: DUF5677 domain-containing protein [Candidatus Omnitrophota bacterium]